MCLAVILAAGSTSFGALELEVPTWRGTEGSTFQQWSFSDDNPAPSPDAGSENPYGPPQLVVDATAPWIPNPLGAWPLSGQIDMYIPNNPQPNDMKEIWLQLIWQPGINPSPVLPDAPWVAVFPNDHVEMFRQDASEDGWIHSLFTINLYPNPPAEWITVKGNIIVDHLAIDTRCVPEPATIALLGFGALVVFRRKRLHA